MNTQTNQNIPSSTLEILKAMDAYYSSPDKWYQGSFAAIMDKDGNLVRASPDDDFVSAWLLPDIQCACLIGNGLRVTNSNHWVKSDWELELLETLKQYPEPHWSAENNTIPFFNDSRSTTFEDVKTLLKKTIQRLESKE